MPSRSGASVHLALINHQWRLGCPGDGVPGGLQSQLMKRAVQRSGPFDSAIQQAGCITCGHHGQLQISPSTRFNVHYLWISRPAPNCMTNSFQRSTISKQAPAFQVDSTACLSEHVINPYHTLRVHYSTPVPISYCCALRSIFNMQSAMTCGAHRPLCYGSGVACLCVWYRSSCPRVLSQMRKLRAQCDACETARACLWLCACISH